MLLLGLRLLHLFPSSDNILVELMNIQVATLWNGATTVSATKFFASMVGTPVFVTGENKMYTSMESRETQGVCVAAYKTHEFSTFSIETSGCKKLSGKAVRHAGQLLKAYMSAVFCAIGREK
ncbi:uncharacterized protein LOC123202981 isoform X3 [Mangifera indica]|uniref:uncharacterized protein LOC123202981 isoform X3 n=1 Tax=Mangifera indica TaxID=29780 RepID=UPI001CF9B5C3|nr:uncharacterized protein LOC123202981 isoform X3 [Mangifera indica]